MLPVSQWVALLTSTGIRDLKLGAKFNLQIGWLDLSNSVILPYY